ncbi:hypothetical protein F5883DRAFT_609060 [Diaporthe sp. PMI_573]|nr:hypothetical protein F5883DRAFT_609060 [Diaporthaceae sp. PMI_573]
MTETIAPDYLVIGAGTMGIAFVDTLITDTKATVAPSAFYGVNSRPLGNGKIDQVGWNKGMGELATGDKIGNGQFRSILTNKVIRIRHNTRIVDRTYLRVKVPSISPPPYKVAKDVSLITLNNLPKVSRPYGRYTVVGTGKTGINACLWLVANGIDPKDISWIMPRGSWLLDRAGLQPGSQFFETTAARLAEVNEAILSASSLEDLFHRLEACRELMRIDDKVWPTMWKYATVTLENGIHEPVPDTLYIDYTSDALRKLDPVPIFDGNRITLQPVRRCQQVFSAAFIAHVEATYGDEKVKNELCRVVPHPNEPIDYPIGSLHTRQNTMRWAAEPKTAAWLNQTRLDMVRTIRESAPEHLRESGNSDAEKKEKKEKAERVCVKLAQLAKV